VWLNFKNVKTDRPFKKLNDKNKKFIIIKVVNSHAYRLDTPFNIDNVFYVFLLRPADIDLFLSQMVAEVQPPAIISENNKEKYEVEEILRARIRKIGRGLRREALVK
jgi:hypothetical protein